MNNYILFDEKWTDFLPLSFTRPISYFRIGILTIKEKWELLLNADFSVKTVDYLSKKYPSIIEDKNILINSRVLPDNRLIEKIQELKLNQYIYKEDLLIAACIDRKSTECFDSSKGEYLGEKIDYKNEIIKIDYLYDIFQKNDKALIDDFNLLTNNKISQPISLTNRCIGEENIYIEEGAKVEFSILNATTGPIYIGKDAEIMEGCMIRGPFSLGNHSQLKMGAKIYGPVTIGPHSRVGGEVTHSVFFGYSNKAHDGFLGHSVIGEWCNLGADTNNST